MYKIIKAFFHYIIGNQAYNMILFVNEPNVSEIGIDRDKEYGINEAENGT
ncbi:hypothetical protein [Gracilibacillus dipsosauri]